jgi:hypothetical protein
VDITNGTTTFAQVPDLPLTDLQVVLTGGPNSAFTPSCNPASATATAALTSQNGDQTVTANAPFTVSNCPPPTPGSGPVITPAKPPPVLPPGKVVQIGRPHLKSVSLHKVRRHRFVLKVSVVAGKNAKGLKKVRIVLPAKLRFALAHGQRLRLRKRVSIRGGHLASVGRSHGRVLVTLRHPAKSVVVSIRGLTVPVSAHGAKRHHFRRLRIVVSVTDAAGKPTRFGARSLRVRVG